MQQGWELRMHACFRNWRDEQRQASDVYRLAKNHQHLTPPFESFRSTELEGFDSPCMVIYLTTHHHIHVVRKERKRTQAIWVAVVIRGERTDQVVFYPTFWGSIHFLRWITGCNTCMNGYVVPIRRDWDQFYGLTWPNETRLSRNIPV